MSILAEEAAHFGAVDDGRESNQEEVDALRRQLDILADKAELIKKEQDARTRRHCQGCADYFPTVNPHPHGNRVCHMDAEGTCERVR